jgi:hypothetical protein
MIVALKGTVSAEFPLFVVPSRSAHGWTATESKMSTSLPEPAPSEYHAETSNVTETTPKRSPISTLDSEEKIFYESPPVSETHAKR